MLKFLFRVLIIIVLAALVYGLFLTYGEKSPEEQAAIKKSFVETVAFVARTTSGALLKSYDKVKEMITAPEPGKTPEP